MLLLCAVFVQAQGKWQIAKEGTTPYYANVNDRWSVCDSVSDIAPPNTHYCIYIKCSMIQLTTQFILVGIKEVILIGEKVTRKMGSMIWTGNVKILVIIIVMSAIKR